MTISLLTALALPLALQAVSPPPSAAPAKPTSFADLPIEQATGPRCGFAFAIVQGWQEAADPRGGNWPNMEEAQAREFFLTAIVRLIDDYDLQRGDVTQMVESETATHQADNFARIEAMMPACLALLEASGVDGG